LKNNEFDKVEVPAISQLVKLGWLYIRGKHLSPEHICADGKPERASLRDVILVKRLDAAIKRINPWISDEHLRKVSREVTHPNFAALMEYNHAFYQTMVNYLSVEQDLGKGRKGQTVKLIDFEQPANNEFICTNQFKVEGNQNIIPDIVCFVNGIPLAVIECKSPYISAPMSEGIDQLRRYANIRNPEDHEGAEKLFWYNQLMISTCRDQAKVGTISSSSAHYGDWKDAYPFTDQVLAQQALTNNVIDFRAKVDIEMPAHALEDQFLDGSALDDNNELPPLDKVADPSAEYNQQPSQSPSYEDLTKVTAQQRLLAGMFSKDNFLDLLQNFIIFETDDGHIIKKVARYQQFRAVNKVIERLKTGKDRKEKSGVVWHTQGSGKSLTMVMLAVKMRRDADLKQYKLVFITDRTQLDEQLSNTFRDAQGETVYNAGSVSQLKELLKKDSSDLVTAMVQKFSDLEKEQEKQKTVAEGFADLNPSDKIIVLADEAHRTQFGGLAMTINAALPNAPKIGFTGTPLLKTQKMGDAFGGYIDEYKINQAVEDGATVKLLYEGREVKSEVAGESLDKLFAEYFGDYTEEEQREIKKKYGVEKAVREAPARIRWVCIDLLKHYKEHIRPDGFKAMIVVGSRHAATIFKKTLDELGAPPSEVIISGDHNDEKYLAQYTDKVHQKNVIANFKKPFGIDKQGTEEKNKKFNNTAFLIVKDMLLTGFDTPIAQVMYIDRKLQDHTLMQAIARVNRTYTGKSCGYVVDYHGLASYLIEALELFSNDDVEGTYQSLKDEIPKLQAAHTRAMSFFKNVKSDDIDDYVLILKDETVRAQFDLVFKKFAKQLNIILPDSSAAPFIADMKLLGKVHNAAKTLYRDAGLDMKEIGEKVRQLVDEHILSTGVDPKIPPVDLLSANFKESIKPTKSDESKASEIESAIKHHITINLDEDPEYYRSLSLRLRDIIEKTAGQWAEQLNLLLELTGDIGNSHQQAAQDVGLSETEFAFYNILITEVTQASDGDVIAETTHDTIKSTTQTLVMMLDEATKIIDFFNKQDQVKRMKKEIKRAVLDQPFGDRALVSILQERFMDLARTKFGNK
jgi:type I restriction enzyme R subunit